ncbi:unnamed protein product [Durusdinium trenchii]|uniref:Kinesin-like protein n=1 Tax=Durusdinium trenchii TaxID=1381693 RepID=A0ABP0M835_9DINO
MAEQSTVVEVNFLDRQLNISVTTGDGEDSPAKETLHITEEDERSLNLAALAQKVAESSQLGVLPEQLMEPLRELRVAGGRATGAVEEAPVEKTIYLRTLGGESYGPFSSATTHTVGQLKSKVSEQLQCPLRQQRLAYGQELLPDGRRLDEIGGGQTVIELQLMLLSSEKCRVAGRLRPMAPWELQHEMEAIWEADQQEARVWMRDGSKDDAISLDFAFGPGAQNEDIFCLVADLPQKALEGFSSAVLALGARKTGKSFSLNALEPSEGLLPRMSQELFERADDSVVIGVSFMSLYHEDFRDLLSPHTPGTPGRNLNLRESQTRGIYVQGLSTREVKSHEELLHFLTMGRTQLVMDCTNMELDSSEVTMIFTIYVAHLSGADASLAQIQVVELADSNSNAQRWHVAAPSAGAARLRDRLQASMRTLQDVVSMLTRKDQRRPIPYRNSKLTRLLQSSLGGGHLLRILATASPADQEQTEKTLRFASELRQLFNYPKASPLSWDFTETGPLDAFAQAVEREMHVASPEVMA